MTYSTAKIPTTAVMPSLQVWNRSSIILKPALFQTGHRLSGRTLGYSTRIFLDYLSTFRFSGDIYAIPGRHHHLPQRTSAQGHCADHAGTAHRDCGSDYFKPSVSDCHQSVPCSATPPKATASWNLASAAPAVRMRESTAPEPRSSAAAPWHKQCSGRTAL